MRFPTKATLFFYILKCEPEVCVELKAFHLAHLTRNHKRQSGLTLNRKCVCCLFVCVELITVVSFGKV